MPPSTFFQPTEKEVVQRGEHFDRLLQAAVSRWGGLQPTVSLTDVLELLWLYAPLGQLEEDLNGAGRVALTNFLQSTDDSYDKSSRFASSLQDAKDELACQQRRLQEAWDKHALVWLVMGTHVWRF
jgi:hypothetical protein